MTLPSGTPKKVYSLRETAQRVGLSVSTVRRKKDALTAAGAVCEPSGWKVPEEAIREVFESIPDTPADTPADTPMARGSVELMRALGEQIDYLESEVVFLREQIGVKDEQIYLLTQTVGEQARAQAVIEAQRAGLIIEASHGAENTPVAGRRPGFWARLFRG